MFKVQAGSVEEYMRFDPGRADDLRALDGLIRSAAPGLPRWFVPGTPVGQPGTTLTMIGYGQFQYSVKGSPVPVTWPILGLALQKNYISLYNSANGDRLPFTCAYAGILGRARVSKKGVVTFSTLHDTSLQTMTEMITAIEAGLAAWRPGSSRPASESLPRAGKLRGGNGTAAAGGTPAAVRAAGPRPGPEPAP